MEHRESGPLSPEKKKEYPEDYQELLEDFLTRHIDSLITKRILRQLQEFSEGKENAMQWEGWTKQDAQDFLDDYQAGRKNQK
jgi:hypothetical protein